MKAVFFVKNLEARGENPRSGFDRSKQKLATQKPKAKLEGPEGPGQEVRSQPHFPLQFIKQPNEGCFFVNKEFILLILNQIL